MGRQIVYCDQCGKLLKEQDFDQRRAHVSENRSFCVECRPLPKEPSAGSSAAHRIPSSAALPALGNATPRPLPRISPGSSTRFHPVQEAPAAAKSKAPILAGAAIAAVVVLVTLVLLMSGGRREEGRPVEAAPPTPPPANVEKRPPPPPGPSPLEKGCEQVIA